MSTPCSNKITNGTVFQFHKSSCLRDDVLVFCFLFLYIFYFHLFWYYFLVLMWGLSKRRYCWHHAIQYDLLQGWFAKPIILYLLDFEAALILPFMNQFPERQKYVCRKNPYFICVYIYYTYSIRIYYFTIILWLHHVHMHVPIVTFIQYRVLTMVH